jgi:cellulose synthase/poly-beta-1,6-N-acetylglucosamine synthase-like glycosyltransferase
MSEAVMIFALISIWFSILITLVVLFGAVHALIKNFRLESPSKYEPLSRYPKVTIIVPAHNEAIVIQDTVYALLTSWIIPRKPWKFVSLPIIVVMRHMQTR